MRNCTRILYTVLNKSWKQHTIKLQLYGHLPPISQTIQVRQARPAGKVKQYSPMDSNSWTHQHWLTGKNIHPYCTDTGCHIEDLPRVMADRGRWWKRIKGIYAAGMPWWWWWWLWFDDTHFLISILLNKNLLEAITR